MDVLGEDITPQAAQVGDSRTAHTPTLDELEAKILTYVMGWRSKLREARLLKQSVWDECWELYRGKIDHTHLQEWQSKMVLPKAWSSVKQATNVIKRLLNAAKDPFQIEADNPDDLVTGQRAEKMTDLAKVFLDQAHWMEEFATSLENGFIMGLGVLKVWWGMVPKPRLETQYSTIPHPSGFGIVTQKQVVSSTVNEGHLFIKAVDPYNFYWLPGSKLNRWVGTLEIIEISKWELMDLARQGIFGPDGVKKVKDIQPRRAQESTNRNLMRFNEPSTPLSGANADTSLVELIEFYGPIVVDDELIERNAHVMIANGTTVLLAQKNSLLKKRPPYIGHSPLEVPFRTEGVGLIENVREIDKTLSKIANLGVDTLQFRLMPLFEVNIDAYENPEDFETGFMPGKTFRRNIANSGLAGIKPIEMNDVSSGAMQMSGMLDRSHQEGALVTELQQSLPRFSGAQTATETTAIQSNQDSFFGSMAADIELGCVQPLVELSTEMIFQFIDTTTDPRVASILGVDAAVLAGIPKADLMDMIAGEFKTKVTGITGQLMKAEALQSLVQFMNLIGQNPQHWLPYINQDALLRRILESFRPAIHDIENIIADPQTVQAKQQAMQLQEQHGALLGLIPHLSQMAHQVSMDKAAEQRTAQQHVMDAASQLHTQNSSNTRLALDAQAQAHAQQMAETSAIINAAGAVNALRPESATEPSLVVPSPKPLPPTS